MVDCSAPVETGLATNGIPYEGMCRGMANTKKNYWYATRIVFAEFDGMDDIIHYIKWLRK